MRRMVKRRRLFRAGHRPAVDAFYVGEISEPTVHLARRKRVATWPAATSRAADRALAAHLAAPLGAGATVNQPNPVWGRRARTRGTTRSRPTGGPGRGRGGTQTASSSGEDVRTWQPAVFETAHEHGALDHFG